MRQDHGLRGGFKGPHLRPQRSMANMPTIVLTALTAEQDHDALYCRSGMQKQPPRTGCKQTALAMRGL